jgi:hypothetical protein
MKSRIENNSVWRATSQTDIEVKKRPDSSVKLTQNIKQDKRDQIADDLNVKHSKCKFLFKFIYNIKKRFFPFRKRREQTQQLVKMIKMEKI